MSIVDKQQLAKREDAVRRLQVQIHEMERIQSEHPDQTDIVVSASAGRNVNQVPFAMSAAIGGMERVRQFMIPNDAFLPPSRFRTSPTEMVPLRDILSSAQRALLALAVKE